MRAGSLLADPLRTPNPQSVADTRSWLELHLGYDLDGLIDSAVEATAAVQLEVEIYGIGRRASLDCEELVRETFEQYRLDAFEDALELDNIDDLVNSRGRPGFWD